MVEKKSEAYRKGRLEAIQGKPEKPRNRGSQGFLETKQQHEKRIRDHYDYREGFAQGKKQSQGKKS